MEGYCWRYETQDQHILKKTNMDKQPLRAESSDATRCDATRRDATRCDAMRRGQEWGAPGAPLREPCLSSEYADSGLGELVGDSSECTFQSHEDHEV